MPPRGPTIAETALQVIHEQGPQQLDVLVAAVVAAGRTRARNPRAAVRAAIDVNPEFIQGWDGRWCSLVDQLDGAVFTTPVTKFEQFEGIVILGNHLALVERLALRSRPFAGGGDVHYHFFGDFFEMPWPSADLDRLDMYEALGTDVADGLLDFLAELGMPPDVDPQQALRELAWEMRYSKVLDGPPGWIPPLGARQLLGIRIRSGAVETVALDRREVAGPHLGVVSAHVARLARLVIGPDPGWPGPPAVAMEELLELVATEAPELLRRPLPPFSEVVERGGLEVHDGWVGHRGTDWHAEDRVMPLGREQAWGFRPDDIVH